MGIQEVAQGMQFSLVQYMYSLTPSRKSSISDLIKQLNL
jgi:hypothetical protein